MTYETEWVLKTSYLLQTTLTLSHSGGTSLRLTSANSSCWRCTALRLYVKCWNSCSSAVALPSDLPQTRWHSFPSALIHCSPQSSPQKCHTHDARTPAQREVALKINRCFYSFTVWQIGHKKNITVSGLFFFDCSPTGNSHLLEYWLLCCSSALSARFHTTSDLGFS